MNAIVKTNVVKENVNVDAIAIATVQIVGVIRAIGARVNIVIVIIVIATVIAIVLLIVIVCATVVIDVNLKLILYQLT